VIARDQVSLGILAGGQATRLGGRDKAWVEYRGNSLLMRTLGMLGDGYAAKLISHPTDSHRFAALGLSSVPDLRPGFPGPLAGIEALLAQCRSDWLLTMPVDMREIPDHLCELLLASSAGQGAVVRDGDGLQPLVCLWPVVSALPRVTAALDGGDGAVHRVIAALCLHVHDISPSRMGNLNQPADFE